MTETIHALAMPEYSDRADASSPCWTTGYHAGDSTVSWIREISKNLITPSYILKRLSKSADPEVRIAVADHKNTSLEVLANLAEDEDPDVRFVLAENHNINRDVLKKLTDDQNPYISHRALKTLARLDCWAATVGRAQ